jgi:hypothetical protein
VGFALLAIQHDVLRDTAVLLQRGVATQATVTDNERVDGLWTLLRVEFPGGSDLPEVAVILHKGMIETEQVQIVYDPLDPVTAQLEGDLQPGMLALEFVGGALLFILDGGEAGRFQFAGVGLLLVVVALVMLVRVLGYRHRLLSIASQSPGRQELRMWLRTDGAKDTDALLERPGKGRAKRLRVQLLAHQDIHGLTEPGQAIQVLGSLADRRWLIIRAPDGRLLLPKASARQVAAAEIPVQGMESADREERLVVRFALGLASLFLAGAVLVAPVLSVPRILLAPQVAVRPGVQSYSESSDSEPITDCGGSVLRVAVLGPRVRADTVQHARQAARACAWSAQRAVVFGTTLLVLVPVMLYIMYRIKKRMDGENAEFSLDF